MTRRVVALLALLTALLTFPLARADALRTDPLDTWKVQTVNVPTNDVTYVASRHVYLATVDLHHRSLGNELIEVQPETGAILRRLFVGSSPRKIAVTDDDTTAYVALDGANHIVKVDLLSFVVVDHIVLPDDTSFGPMYAADVAVAPGRNDVIVAALSRFGISPPIGGVYAFEDGVALDKHTISHASPSNLEFVGSNTIYGYDLSGGNELYRLSLDDDGVTLVSEVHNYESGWGHELERVGELIATSSGQLIDPAVPQKIRTFDASGAFEPTPTDDRITFASAPYPNPVTIKQFSLSSGELIGSRTFDGVRSPHELTSSLTGYALATSSALVLLGPHVIPGDVPIPTPAKSTVNSLGETVLWIDAKDFVYDTLRNRLYATVGKRAAKYANELVVIDALTGVILDRRLVGDDPNHIALSDDFSTLYIGLGDVNEIVQVSVPLLLPLLPLPEVPLALPLPAPRFSTGDRWGQAVFAGDIAVMPGQPDVVAATLHHANSSHSQGVALFRAGVRQPDIGGWNTVELMVGDATTLYGTDSGVGYGKYVSMEVTETGLTNTLAVTDYFGNIETDSAGVGWSSSGYSFNPADATLRGWLWADGAVESVPGTNRVYIQHGEQLVEYERDRFRPLGSRLVKTGFSPNEMIKTKYGFATRSYQSILLLNPVFCEGRLATVTATAGQATGTSGDDVIVGSSLADVIDGGGGNDLICGAGGDDTITGGSGNDRVIGGVGKDTLRGGDGNDVVLGGAGNDQLFNDIGADDLDGGAGTDSVHLGDRRAPTKVDLDNVADDGIEGEKDNVRATNEYVVGSHAADTITGSPAAQVLIGNGGEDILIGFGGSDVLDGGDGNDALLGGLGIDSCRGGKGTDTYTSCERVDDA